MTSPQEQAESIARAIRALTGKLHAARGRADRQMVVGMNSRYAQKADAEANALSKRIASEWKTTRAQITELLHRLSAVPHSAAYGMAQRLAEELKRDLGADLTRQLRPNSGLHRSRRFHSSSIGV